MTENVTNEVSLRPALTGDGGFLREMHYLAIYPDDTVPAESWEETFKNPRVIAYTDEWGRSGDYGIIAESQEGAGLGAAWYRLFGSDSPGYGFIDPETPEIGIAVVAEARGRGLGRRLLTALIARAQRDGYPALSLAVRKTNIRARRLYESCGFSVVSAAPDSDEWLMRCPLGGGK
jgi:ribosomal protein S18 acetylase RimI-like enzyme